ncbi:hypothetical protein AB0O52_01530 [Arthrobacter sp. NPDC080073]|uniref:hypothetical protein n=1 Tax=Arthrobacter sp. NPDC080073 TaxID=3155919 RepID=UPI003415B67A
MRKLSKKGKIYAAAATVTLVAASGGAAYAYWTTTGSGSGGAANSTGGGTVTLHATFAAGLAPGNSTSVAYTADNASNTDTVVGALSATVSTSDPTHCLASWFTVTASTSNSPVAHNSSGTSVGSGTLTFLNDAANQDACKSATVTVNVGSL